MFEAELVWTDKTGVTLQAEEFAAHPYWQVWATVPCVPQESKLYKVLLTHFLVAAGTHPHTLPTQPWLVGQELTSVP
jgi:hypothetical protein